MDLSAEERSLIARVEQEESLESDRVDVPTLAALVGLSRRGLVFAWAHRVGKARVVTFAPIAQTPACARSASTGISGFLSGETLNRLQSACATGGRIA